MQFDVLRAFPYPVLRRDVNDYIEGDIQATVEFHQSDDGLDLTAEIDFVVSVPELVSAIKDGKAAYSVVVACRDTYFRHAILSQTSKFSHAFKSGAIRGEVLIYPYVVATEHIEGFTCPWINPEFGDGPFRFENGSALAIEAPQSIYVDRDSFKPISSAFVLVKNADVPENEWRVEASQDKVRISVNPDTKAKIDAARNSSANKAVLLNSIYLGAVIQCLALLKKDSSYDEFRWANIFRARCDEMSIDIDQNAEAWIAQQLMRHPLKLIDTYIFEKSET